MTEACSHATRAAAEPLLGTASVGARYVFVSWPKGQWGPKALETEGLAPLATWGRAFDARHPGKTVIRLFAAPADAASVEARVFPAGLAVRDIPLAELPSRLDAVFEDLEAGRRPPELLPLERTLAVCTHGKHDQCCARHGQAVFRALSAEAATLDATVMETSHLGGHRFASTLIDFAPGEPGRMYGQLTVEDVPSLVDQLVHDRVWLERYRGRVDLGPEAQIVEARALAVGARGPITIERLDEARFEARWTGGALEVEVPRQIFEGIKKCGGPRETWTRPVPPM